ncbi:MULTISPECIES: DUF3349 domain-containing protein [Arsenicicoccus]|jgi:hypothetical protein|uniref:DUF3349 domain-containing protein n=1 Tax=Arsenicicoccus bolidensis TaxID=229480 RepID=A0ABS9PXG1_9MICO|nr:MULTISPECIES: DUF3349 domain-containing protein [Arsenicicoccus]MCG7320302.1 DUF3349 domain-containing protein [Arsenicicoccus bolidensis]
MTSFIERALNWLRAGYPGGVPDTDYQPLLALLRRRLTDDEVDELGQELVRRGMVPAGKIDVGVGITRVIDELPTEEEMHRVGERLREGGWPVDLDEARRRREE